MTNKESELRLIELDPAKHYVVMFRGYRDVLKWEDKPANVSDIMLNEDKYTIVELEELKEVKTLIANKEREARLDEIKELVIAWGSYPTNRGYYSGDDEGIYVVPVSDVNERIAALDQSTGEVKND